MNKKWSLFVIFGFLLFFGIDIETRRPGSDEYYDEQGRGSLGTDYDLYNKIQNEWNTEAKNAAEKNKTDYDNERKNLISKYVAEFKKGLDSGKYAISGGRFDAKKAEFPLYHYLMDQKDKAFLLPLMEHMKKNCSHWVIFEHEVVREFVNDMIIFESRTDAQSIELLKLMQETIYNQRYIHNPKDEFEWIITREALNHRNKTVLKEVIPHVRISDEILVARAFSYEYTGQSENPLLMGPDRRYRDVRYIEYKFGDPCADELLRKINSGEYPTALKIAQCMEKNREARNR